MSGEFQIEIAPNGDKLRVVARGGKLGPAGEVVERAQFSFEQEDDPVQLRRGRSKGPLVKRVTAKLSQWLLGDDLNARLEDALHDGNLRLVFNVDKELYARFSDVPIEMIELKGVGTPLVLNPKVDSLVHLLPKVGTPQGPLTPLTWPLRVLFVRSNPLDLGGAVPEAAPIRDFILDLGKQIAPVPVPGQPPAKNPVEIELLSREQGVDRPATWDAFRDCLKNRLYHILVYLGHGDLRRTAEDQLPIGVLQFETSDGKSHKSVQADQVAVVLDNRPVPVVLLTGCVTATEVDNSAMKDEILEKTPEWVRGSQGVAQTLVNSESGVQFAVGMRYMLETGAAVEFLETFFESLLQDKDKAGNVEAAVRAGRIELHADKPVPPSWSAPVVFRTLGTEPTFGFIATAPVASVDNDTVRKIEAAQQARALFWQIVMQMPMSARTPAAFNPIQKALNDADQSLQDHALTLGSLLVPVGQNGQPDGQATVPVVLHGALDVDLLEGRVLVTGEGVSIQDLQRNALLLKPGEYQFLKDPIGNEATFVIRRMPGGSQLLPEGALFNVALTLGPVVPTIYAVSVELIRIEPQRVIWPGSNAVIVPKQ